MAVSSANPSGITGLPRRLVDDGIVDQATITEAVQAAKRNDLTLVSYLVAEQLADPRDIAIAASAEFGVPLLDLEAMEIDLQTVQKVPENLLLKHRVLPLLQRGKKLFLGISDPTNLAAIDEVKFAAACSVEAVVVQDDKLQQQLDRALDDAQSTSLDTGDDDLDLDFEEESADDAQDDVSRDDLEDAPIVRFVNKILLDAIQKGASDIHFEPYEKIFRVRTRQDGVLKQVATPPVQLAGKVSARIKVMARLDIAERRVPQDGRIKMRLSKSRAIDFRVNTCPTLFGEKIVLRILDPSSAKLGIELLGYEDHQRALYENALAKPYGMILVTGPTGSGKTVSLYTGLNILNTEDRNISTAEDPAEINLPGINQVNVNPKVGLTFASALKAFLRQDPDVIMVGEIRDLETAEIAIKAAQTGHLVLSTLHTNDAPKTLTRMVDMGVKPYAIASSVTLIIAQRLARRLCSECKEPVEVPRDALIKEGFTEEDLDAPDFTLYRPIGCKKCSDGYKGRVGIYQVMPVTETIGRIIMEGGNAIQIADQAAAEGVADLRRAGLVKAIAGITSLDEVNRVTVE